MNTGWWFDDEPAPAEPAVWHLFTDREAETLFGINTRTLQSWRRRNKITPKGLDGRGRPMYERSDLLRLRDATPRKTQSTRVELHE